MNIYKKTNQFSPLLIMKNCLRICSNILLLCNDQRSRNDRKEISKLLNDANKETLKYPTGQFPNLTHAIDQLLQIKAGLNET